VTGFVFDGPRAPAPVGTGASFSLDPATGTGPAGVTLGAPCTTGNDCAALGAHAACWRSGGHGFCTIDCDLDAEGPSTLCPTGSYCFTSLRADGGRLCMPTCAADADCPTGELCSASLGTFNVASGRARACLPSCASDADCNVDTSGLVCRVAAQRCESPREILGSRCTSDADCFGLGTGGACMRSTRDPSASYCTRACDLAAGVCTIGGTDPLGPCVSGYATTSDGADVPVCLRACASDDTCRARSANTCNYLPSLSSAAWTALRSAGAWRRPKGRRAPATRSIERPTGRSTR